ncbi:transposase family protein [Streptomyces boncukensis]|uniref:Transposase family protein n=1 Tax=Streptomyces boncukensis TaxID=2711219 RepID=A0A6G4X0T0_9ACTN|nr:transposase family protein [Streptomyces boncukensis]NGO70271.1 transposase family protein [Streptomyces boncukensis]
MSTSPKAIPSPSSALTTETNGDPLYSGKHPDHGVNVQGLTDAEGELVYLGRARPGSTTDLPAARAGGTVRTLGRRPRGKGHNGWEKLTDSAHARLRAPVERAFAVLKRWRVLDLVRISPNRITGLLHAILAIIQKRSSLASA